jgi:hypothetical protein
MIVIAFHSKNGARLSAPLPGPLGHEKDYRLALYPDHAEEAHIEITGGKVSLDASASRPILVFRDSAAGRVKLMVK